MISSIGFINTFKCVNYVKIKIRLNSNFEYSLIFILVLNYMIIDDIKPALKSIALGTKTPKAKITTPNF